MVALPLVIRWCYSSFRLLARGNFDTTFFAAINTSILLRVFSIYFSFSFVGKALTCSINSCRTRFFCTFPGLFRNMFCYFLSGSSLIPIRQFLLSEITFCQLFFRLILIVQILSLYTICLSMLPTFHPLLSDCNNHQIHAYPDALYISL